MTDFHETNNPYTYYDDSQITPQTPFDETPEDEKTLQEKQYNKKILRFVGYMMIFPSIFMIVVIIILFVFYS